MPSLEQLPAVNASLNFLATTLLLIGYGFILMGRERLHIWTMCAAFGTSVAFLVSYLIYHAGIGGGRPFTGEGWVRPVYFAMLISHIVLAAVVPWMAIATIYFGWTDQRQKHRRFARWTLPIWLYVSVTGVLIYLFLYVFYPSSGPSTLEIAVTALLDHLPL